MQHDSNRPADHRPLSSYEDRLRSEAEARVAALAPELKLLSTSSDMMSNGNAEGALALLTPDVVAQFSGPWQAHGWMNRSHARSQLGDEVGCAEELLLVDPDAGPAIAARHLRMQGAAHRRTARALLKAGLDKRIAIPPAQRAVEKFDDGYVFALTCDDRRLAAKLMLDELYSRGLLALIQDETKEKNVALVVLAVQAAAEFFEATPRGEPRSLFAATLLADLCRPLQLSPADLFDLCGTLAHAAACRKLFGRLVPADWPSYLVREVEAHNQFAPIDGSYRWWESKEPRPPVPQPNHANSLEVARALVLAADMIQSAKRETAISVQNWLKGLATWHERYIEKERELQIEVIRLPGVRAALAALSNLTKRSNSPRWGR